MADTAPAILVQPQGRAALPGSSVSFGVMAYGSSPLFYSSQRDGTTVGTGSEVLELRNASSADAGNYRVVITNGFGSVTSQVARLVVGPSELELRLAAGAELSLLGISGRTYLLEQAAELPPTNGWQPFATAFVTNGTALVTDPAKGPRRFYRAALLP